MTKMVKITRVKATQKMSLQDVREAIRILKTSTVSSARMFGKISLMIAKQRQNIIDDFCIAYIAQTGVPINKLELVEECVDNKYTWHFRMKRET